MPENLVNTTFRDLITMFNSSSIYILDGDSTQKYEEKRDSLHYNLTLDETILKAKSVYSLQCPNASNSEFIDWFITHFHHSWLTDFCSVEIRNRNERVQIAYKNILETIYRTQSWLEEEKLRTKIEVNWENRGASYNLVHQTVTMFCNIVLACNQKGEYYISYILDYRCQELLNKYFTNTLLRRIYEFTTDDLEPYLNLNDLLRDGIEFFDNLLKESEKDESIKVYSVSKA